MQNANNDMPIPCNADFHRYRLNTLYFSLLFDPLVNTNNTTMSISMVFPFLNSKAMNGIMFF